jgi:hypothetical protein
VYAGQMDEATLLLCGWLIEYFREDQIPIHPNITKKFLGLVTKLGTDERFFERW